MAQAERVLERADPAYEELAKRVQPVTLALEHTLPLVPEVEGLFPGGVLRRGSTIVVGSDHAQGATTLAFRLAAAATSQGSWCAALGFDDLGIVAVAELGVDLARLALVPFVDSEPWLATAGALLDATDILVVRCPPHLRQGDARRLVIRARHRGAVLIPVLGSRGSWVETADHRLTVTRSRWEGAGQGDGHLIRRLMDVAVKDRGAPRLAHVS